MDKGSLIIGVVSAGLTIIFGVWGLIAVRKKPQKMKKLSADERLQKINAILLSIGQIHIYLNGCAFIFMPNGEIIFGAGWVNKEWLKLLDEFVSQNKDKKIAPSAVGEEYYISDLITGNNIRIPLHPVEGMTIDKDGIALGHMYIFTKY
jgi:hypothetical protein